MTYGKVTVKQERGIFTVYVGAGEGMTLKKQARHSMEAYSDARYIRQTFKMGEHPGAVCQRLGGYVIQEQEATR